MPCLGDSNIRCVTSLNQKKIIFDRIELLRFEPTYVVHAQDLRSELGKRDCSNSPRKTRRI